MSVHLCGLSLREVDRAPRFIFGFMNFPIREDFPRFRRWISSWKGRWRGGRAQAGEAGMAGANAFDRSEMVAAQRLTDEALRECERTGDVAGVTIYSENLANLVTTSDGAGQGAFRRRLARAQKLHDAGRLIEARTLLLDVIAVVDAAPRDAPERGYRSKAHGLLGKIFYRMHDPTWAEDETRLALEAGKEAGDEAAVVIYTANLDVLRRG